MRGPGENGFVVSAPESHVLDADQVDARKCTSQSTNNVVIEVLVRQPTQESFLKSGEQAFANAVWGRTGMIEFSGLARFPPPLNKIRLQFG